MLKKRKKKKTKKKKNLCPGIFVQAVDHGPLCVCLFFCRFYSVFLLPFFFFFFFLTHHTGAVYSPPPLCFLPLSLPQPVPISACILTPSSRRRSFDILTYRRIFIHHTGIFQHIRPFATSSGVAVFEVLAEMVGTIKLLARIAFSELVYLLEVLGPRLSILIRYHTTLALGAGGSGACEFFATVPARIRLPGTCRAFVEGPLVACECRT